MLLYNLFQVRTVAIAVPLALASDYLIGTSVSAILSWFVPIFPQYLALLILFFLFLFSASIFFPAPHHIKSSSKGTFSCRCLDDAKPSHTAGHLAMKHYLKHKRKDRKGETISVETENSLMAVAGVMGEAIVTGELVNTQSDDFVWLMHYLIDHDLKESRPEVLVNSRNILIKYPLSKMAENIGKTNKGDGPPSLFGAANNRGKMGGAYDDTELFPFMDR